MDAAALILFDDHRARDWQPFTLTRPAGELLFGTMTLRERAERVLGAPCIGHLSRESLRGFDEPGAPPVLSPDAGSRDRPVLYLCSRAVPDRGAVPFDFGGRSRPIRIDGETCGWLAAAGDAAPGPDFFEDPAANTPNGAPAATLDGVLLERVWDLVAGNPDRTARDIEAMAAGAPRLEPPRGVHVLGTGAVIARDGAAIEPQVVLDTRDGPILLDEGVTVRSFSRVVGPTYIGRGTTLLGGPFEAVSAGPVCKLHGEIEETVVLGYTNKAHDGFLGHAYLGRWVNLGALTTNSDLKNNYGPVRITTPAGETDTGLTKLGCLLGDHVKTAIGTLINTGTVVGAGSNLFGGMPAKWVPPFTWGTGEGAGAYDLEKFLEVAELVMARREVELTEGQKELLRRAWHETRNDPN